MNFGLLGWALHQLLHLERSLLERNSCLTVLYTKIKGGGVGWSCCCVLGITGDTCCWSRGVTPQMGDGGITIEGLSIACASCLRDDCDEKCMVGEQASGFDIQYSCFQILQKTAFLFLLRKQTRSADQWTLFYVVHNYSQLKATY